MGDGWEGDGYGGEGKCFRRVAVRDCVRRVLVGKVIGLDGCGGECNCVRWVAVGNMMV